MDNRIYGRITKNSETDFTLEVFAAILLETHNGYGSYKAAELAFHFCYPDGYIIPDWLGI